MKKTTIRRVFALVLIWMMLLPSFTPSVFMESLDLDEELQIDLGGEDLEIPSDDLILLDDMGDPTLDLDDLALSSNDTVPEALPFEQTVTFEDVTVRVTAAAGVMPDGSSCRISDVIEDSVAESAREAVEAALPGKALRHHLYHIELLDRDGNTVLPSNGLPVVSITGLDITGILRVFAYNKIESYETDGWINDREITFNLAESAIYDIVDVTGEKTVEQPEQQPVDEQQGVDEQQPSDEQQQEQPVADTPAVEDVPQITDDGLTVDDVQIEQDGQPVGEEQPEQQAVDDRQQTGDQQGVDDQQPTDWDQPSDEESTQPSDDKSDQPAGDESAQPSSEQTDQPTDEESAQVGGDEGSEQPTDEKSEQPADEESAQPADKESAQPVDEQQDQPSDEESDQPTEEESDQTSGEESAQPAGEESDQSTDEESDQAVDDQQPSDGDSEQPTDEESAQPADEQAVQPVTVVFNAVPETAVITVYVVENEETVEPIPAEEDGSFALLPGKYAYSAEAEGYKAIEAVPFTVEESEEPLTITIELEAEETEKAEETEEAEPLPFDQSATVDGVVITVRAETGAFPNNAELSVKHVYAGRVKQAGEAVDEVRDEDQNVAASYTFDIKVIDPITKEEIQPAEGYTVEVSFALAEAADENLEANVYHITGTGKDMTAEALDTDTEGETVTATTDGFSLYTVEFTYNALEYVLEGGRSVALSEILGKLGLTGTPTAVAVSNSALFDATREGGQWVVAAKKPFSSTEWMKVTIGEVTYDITVTDDQEYDLWVGGVQVTSANLDDVLGNQTYVKYEPDSKTLTFPANITVSGTQGNAIINSYISPLNIKAPNGLTLNDSNASYGIQGGEFTVDTGKNILTIKAKSYGFNTGGVTVNGSVNIQVGEFGFIARDVTVNGDVTIVSDNGQGIVGDNVTLNGNIDIQADGFSICANRNLSLDYGTCSLSSNKSHAITCGGNAALEGTSFMASSTGHDGLSVSGKLTLVSGEFVLNGYGRAIQSNKDIEIQNKVTRVYGKCTSTSYGAIVSYGGKITLADNLRIVTPEDGYVLTDTTSSMIVDEDGNKALEVEILSGKAVTVASATNGKVTADPAYALKGETVTLTVKPDDNYALAALSVSDGTNTIGATKVSDTTYTFTMPDAPVTVTATFAPPHVHGGITFQPTAVLPTTPGDYYLTADVETTGSWVLPNGTVRLCLNGHTVNTGDSRTYVREGQTLEIYDDDEQNGIITCTDAYTIEVHGGAFTLHGGTLRGPDSSAGGGSKSGVALFSGSFTMDGGAITGYNGYGVYASEATFTLSGGSIAGNAPGGIYVNHLCDFFLSGAPDFSGTANAGADIDFNNAYGDALVTVDGTLTKPGKKIRVSMKKPGVFTKNWKTKMGTADPADYFASDSIRYGVRLTDGGEAELYQRPEWAALQEDIAAAGTKANSFDLIDYDFDNDGEIVAEATDGPLTIVSGQNITLDLHGRALDRGLTQAKDDGNAVTVNGTLTVTDGAGGGVITGGRNKGNGGGVIVNDTFNMQGGTVTGNSALNDGNGGGVYLNGGTLTLSDSATISGNSARHGGGVYMGGGAFKMSGSVEISGNTTANNGDGGGVCVNGGGFEMSGGSITRNTTAGYGYGGGVCVGGGSFEMSGSANIFLNSAKRGGGVDVSSGASFTMTGGSIATNTTADNTYDGGGVYVGGTFSVSGAPNISGNVKGGKIENGALSGGTANNVFLASGWSGSKTVTVAGALSNTVKIGVSMGSLGVVTSGYPTYCVDGDGKPLVAGTYFVSDKGYTLGLNADNEVEVPQHTVSVTITGIKGADGRPSVGYKLSDGTEGTLYYWSGDTKSFTVPAGMDATLTAGTLQAYSFINWEEDNTITGTDAALTISNVTANHNIIAHYLQTHIVVNAAIDGRDWQDGDAFTFNVAAVEDDAPKPPQAALEVLSTTTNHAVAFGNLPFTGGMLNKTYHYKVTQTKGDVFGIAYDTGEKEVAYQVVERANGGVIELLPASVQEVTFTNTLVLPTVADTDYFFGKVSNLQADVTAAAAEGFDLSYQWYSCDKDGKNRVKLDGEENQQYTLPTDLGAGEHYYLCEVTGTHQTSGKATAVDSNVAKANVRPQLVTLTANSGEVTYDGTEKTVTGFTCSVSGLEFADTVKASASGTDAGEYWVDFSGVETHVTTDTTGNYVVDNLDFGTLTIKPKAVTITAKDAAKTYDGKALTEAGFTASALEAGDAHKFTVAMTDASTITYAGNVPNVIATVDGTAVASGVEKRIGNYLITTQDGTLTVNPASATVTITGHTNTAAYDGKAHTVSGYDFKASTPLYTAKDFTFTGKAEASRTDTGKTSMGLKVNQFKNISPNFNTVTFNVTDGYQKITSAAITITADDKASAYGKPLQTLTYAVGGAYVQGDDLGVTLSTTATSTTNVGTYPIAVAWNKNPNYTAELIEGTYTITKDDLTVTASGYSGVYDGKAHSITVTAKGTGITIYYGTQKLTSQNYSTAGSTTQITRTDAGKTTVYYYAVGSNYEAVSGSKDVEISRAAATVTADAKSKTYGDKDPKLTYAVDGLLNGDSLSGDLVRDAGEDVGSYTITQGTLKASGNYDLIFTGAVVTIKPAVVTVAAVSKSKTYGNKDPRLTAKVSGLKNGDKASVIKYTLTRKAGKNVGSYAITAKGKARQGNYTVTYKGAKLTIKPRPLTVTAKAKTKRQGEADPKLTYTVKGLLKGDKLTGKLSRKPGEAPGKYAITQGTLKASRNYRMIFKGAVLTILANPTKPDITVQATVETVGDDEAVLAWTKVNGAYKYDVFFKACGSGKGYTLVNSTKGLSCEIDGLQKGTSYKAYVKAWRPKGKRKDYIGKPSPMLHFIAGGYSDEFCNPKEVTVKRSNITLRKGRTGVIEASVVGVRKDRTILDHEDLVRYYSSDTRVAQVLGNGLFKAVGKGNCEIIVMAVNGVSTRVRVRVK